MINQRIIYQDNDGGVSILIPAPECLQTYTIEEIAAKDVPTGKPYKIVDVNDIPSDRTFRGAWGVDPSILTDGIGAESDNFPVKK